ncbi:hypothetical protein QT971_03695 [Microcoleus sp. herbarium19]
MRSSIKLLLERRIKHSRLSPESWPATLMFRRVNFPIDEGGIGLKAIDTQ